MPLLLTTRTRKFLAFSGLILLAACAAKPLKSAPVEKSGVVPPPSYADYDDRSPCRDRIGRCFDATVAGQPVIAIAEKKRHEELTAFATRINDSVSELYWEIAEPIDGRKAFKVVLSTNGLGGSFLGEQKSEPDVAVFPLDNQQIKFRVQMATNPRVRINGQSSVTLKTRPDQNFLPSGRYVISINYDGTRNWDRKFVYLRVK